MKQQAIDILKDEIKVQEEMWNNYFISVLKFLIEKMESLWDGWIPVTERLPEKEWEYLVYWASWKLRIAKFQKATNFDRDAYFYMDNPNPKKRENWYIPLWPKFWMPLPLPPNK